MTRRTSLAAALAAIALTLAPALAQAHVSLHPNVIPSGAYATLVVRVPNESDSARTVLVRMQVPDGFTSVAADPPPGWSVAYKTQQLARAIQGDDGPITSEVREIDWTAAPGKGTPPGQFLELPIAVAIPGRAGSTIAFPTVQTYSDGKIARWIGPPSADMPAPTIDVSAAGGPLLDVAGGEAGPPASAADLTLAGAASRAPPPTASSGGASKALAITALVIGILGLLAGLGGLLAARAARRLPGHPPVDSHGRDVHHPRSR